MVEETMIPFFQERIMVGKTMERHFSEDLVTSPPSDADGF
jgi:hypothetical protein